ncbi:MAG: hypothetical protein E7458_09870 [Ruminococcaceae bacterium]|nr:hypothetical protein [Oscillospiraceae bacterium]
MSIKKVLKSLKNRAKKLFKAGTKFLSMKVLFPACYNFYRLRPVDERRVVFVEVRMRAVSDNYALLYDALKCGYDFDLRVHFLEELLVPMATTYRRSIRALKDIAQAKYVFVNDATNMINAVHVRPETRVIQTWHACGPFKMFGYSVADLKFGATRRQMELYPIHRNYTHLILGGTESVGPYAEAMGMEDKLENIYPIGVSRTDVFYDPAFIGAAREKLYRLMPEAQGKQVILYAPTFRGRVATATTPDILRYEMLQEAFGDRYVMVSNHHPFVKKRPKIPESCRGFAQDMTGRMSIEELLCVSDICITDYSSLVFEYSLFRRPMIFFAYDLADYYDWRGFYYQYEDFVCGPIVTTNLELIDTIRNIDSFDLSHVEAFRERFMTACDGHATERILDTVFGKDALDAHRRAEPLSGDFHKVPVAPKRREEKLSARLRELFFGRYLPRVYARAAKKPVSDTAIFLQYRGKTECEDFRHLREQLPMALSGLTTRTILLSRDGGGGLSYLRACRGAARALAQAKVLVTRETMPLTAALPLREETVHLHLPEAVYPLESFGRDQLSFRGGYAQPFGGIPYESVTLAPASAASLRPLFSAAYGQDAPALGAPELDLLRDDAYAAESRRLLEELFPAAAGKRIMLYAPASRRGKKGKKTAPQRPDVQLLLEYLGKDWVFVAFHEPKCGGHGKLPFYYDTFYADLTGKLPLLRLMAAADLVITDFRAGAMAFSATGRPLLPYAPDYALEIPARALREGWDQVYDRPFIADTMALIEAIRTAAPGDAMRVFDCADGTRRILTALREKLDQMESLS